ncbi:hypothetical protein TNCV_4227211 [Trichonephila clavipes]|nr:hypothetical protein TNCV_4227211 [Trichonephila clavipes]
MSNSVRSSELGGYRSSTSRPMQLLGFAISSQLRTGEQKCAGSPSWNFLHHNSFIIIYRIFLGNYGLSKQFLCTPNEESKCAEFGRFFV